MMEKSKFKQVYNAKSKMWILIEKGVKSPIRKMQREPFEGVERCEKRNSIRKKDIQTKSKEVVEVLQSEGGGASWVDSLFDF